MTIEDQRTLKEKNKKRLRDVINLGFALGVNLTAPSTFKDNLRIISAILVALSCFDLYGHVAFIMRHKDSIIEIAESMFTLLQVIIAIVKLIYMTSVRLRFCEVLRKMQTHELIDQIDLLANGFPTLFPFWEDKMNQYPYYPILTFVVGCANYVGGVVALSVDGTFIFMAMHGVALFRILRKTIVFTTSPNVPKELRVDYLRQCIVLYEETYQYCVEVNNLYQYISFMQFVVSLFILGVVMFQMALGLESDFNAFVRMLFYLSAGGFEVVIYCFNGQFITNESEAVPFAWYDCEWYNESREYKQLIKMMIMRSNKAIIMKASGFTTMSLPTFLEICRKICSYCLVLRKLAF